MMMMMMMIMMMIMMMMMMIFLFAFFSFLFQKNEPVTGNGSYYFAGEQSENFKFESKESSDPSDKIV